MNKTEALAKLAALEAETAALRKIIEAPEAPPSLLHRPAPGSYWQVSYGSFGSTSAFENSNSRTDQVFGGNTFQSESLAQVYADAFETMMLLRHQPGTEAARDEEKQWMVSIEEGFAALFADDWHDKECKARCISPCFSTKEAAELAIQTVGAERILRMFKTFHHVEDKS